MSNYIAVYGAILSTALAAIQFMRWTAEGPKLVISAIVPETGSSSVIFSGEQIAVALPYLIVTADNRGNATTTITDFGVILFPDSQPRWRWVADLLARWHPGLLIQWHGEQARTFRIQPRPGGLERVPHELKPAQRWRGMSRLGAMDLFWLESGIKSGTAYVAVYTTTADQPFLHRILRPAKPPKNAEVLGGPAPNA